MKIIDMRLQTGQFPDYMEAITLALTKKIIIARHTALAKDPNFICANNFIISRGNQESRNAST